MKIGLNYLSGNWWWMPSPSKEALEAYHAAIDPLFKKMLASDLESQSLTKLRDTLLPKLISGRLGVIGSN